MPPPELRRRVVLRLLAATTAAAALPAGCTLSPFPVGSPPAAGFFTAEERRALGALANHVLPADDTPGAAELGAVEYIERLLTALEHDPPHYHAGGPFSGRQPFPDEAGAPGKELPPNGFATFVPLDRVTLAGVRLYLYGSAGLENGGPNDGVLGPVIGLRDLIGGELRTAMAASAAPIETLDADALKAVWQSLSSDFRQEFIGLVAEGTLSAPEYGGNKDLGGWQLANFDGDSMPLGYSYYDAAKDAYVERSDKPVSTADPGDDPHPLDEATLKTLDSLVKAAGGKKFS